MDVPHSTPHNAGVGKSIGHTYMVRLTAIEVHDEGIEKKHKTKESSFRNMRH